MCGSLKLDRPVHCVDFNSDGKYLAVGFKDGEVMIIECTEKYDKFTICDSKRQRNSRITDVK